MKSGYCTFLLVVLALVVGCQRGEMPSPERQEADSATKAAIEVIDGHVRGLVQGSKTAGVVFGVQVAESEPVVHAYGFSSVEEQTSAEPSTAFNLASLTKPFTATAIALLIERNRLALDDSLTRFFPSFPSGDRVTVYHLLSHTSGIADWWVGGLPEGTPDDWTTAEEPHQYLANMNTVYLFEPGAYYSYSNSGYVLLGEIIEQVAGEPYEHFLKKNVFDPAGMKNTRMAGDEESLVGYSIASEGEFTPVPFAAGILTSAGGLVSTVPDLLAWSAEWVEGRLVDTGLVQAFTAYALVEDQTPVYDAVFMPEGMPEQAPPAYMSKNGYGLGFNRTEMFGKPVVWHSGGMPGFNSIWIYLPESRTTFVILSNTDNGAVPAFEPIMQVLTEL